MKTIWLILPLLAACATAPKEEPKAVKTVTVKDLAKTDLTNIDQTAAISARVKWCGYDFQPFYLTAMQYEKQRNHPTAVELAMISQRHGAMFVQDLQTLQPKACGPKELEKLRTDYDHKLNQWCKAPGRSKELEARCSIAKLALQ